MNDGIEIEVPTAKFYGVCTGEQGTGVGDILTGTDWKKTSEGGAQLLAGCGNWIDVYTVFTGHHIVMKY